MAPIWRTGAATIAAAIFVTACGGDSESDNTSPAPDMRRGSLLAPPSATLQLSASGLANQLGNSAAGQALLNVAGAPACGVSVYQMEYATIGGAQESTNATGAIMAPTGTDPACTGPRPVLLYAHGTSTERGYNLANLVDATAPAAGEASLIATMYAAQGFIVVAPNYAGYHGSQLPYHPYLDAAQQSADMTDSLSAARKAFGQLQINASGALLLSGYSQGGYVAMATHRALQAQGEKVTASAPLSGPYALTAFGDAIFAGRVNLGATAFVPMMVTAYQKALGNLYTTPTDIYTTTYAQGIDGLLPSTTSLSTLWTQGKLPQTALFSNEPPAPSLADITPATTPAAMAPLFALGFGPQHLINNATRLSYLQDVQAHPDGATPSTSATHPLRKALIANDLRGWTPTSPVLLCGGSQDPTVFFNVNTGLMQSLWTAPSPLAPAAGLLTVLDVDSAAEAGDGFATIKHGFAQAKAATANSSGASGVVQAYHGSLVPPFCAAAARGFFQQVLAAQP